jgi:hypothetical protein
VERTFGGRGDEREIDRGLGDLAELDLRLLGGLLEPLERHLVGAEVDPVVVLEGLDQPVDHALVPVVATELGVAVGRLHLEDALADLQE